MRSLLIANRGESRIMRRNHECEPAVLMELAKQLENGSGRIFIQVARWFIGKDQYRILH